MKYNIIATKEFRKELKLCIRRGYPIEELQHAIELLSEYGSLPEKYKPHKLIGNYIGAWECHIRPDWLLIWQQDDKELYLLLLHTGTHADLF